MSPASSERIQADADALLASSIPIFTTLAQLREWRNVAFAQNKSVGFVPTMGALHEGHLSLVRRSLADTDLTVVSIFVNPTQFAPHEDLDSYPRTLPQDLAALASLRSSSNSNNNNNEETEKTTTPHPSSSPLAVFLPSLRTMYPSSSNPSSLTTTGTFIEVPDLQQHMEGAARSSFFRGVATVVTKLFNAVQPSRAYVGQKDIQQALLLRRMCADLLLAHPPPEALHVVPTERAPDGLALSSRNAYLGAGACGERGWAPVLYRALREGEGAWGEGATVEEAVRAAVGLVEAEKERAEREGVRLALDYIQMNDSRTLQVVDGRLSKASLAEEDVLILSGALWVGMTRLIDNILLGDVDRIMY